MNKCIPGELYLIGTDQVYTMQQCLEYLITLSTKKGIRYAEDSARVRLTENSYFIADCSKFRNATGWMPEYAFKDTMQNVLEYWRGFIDEKMY